MAEYLERINREGVDYTVRDPEAVHEDQVVSAFQEEADNAHIPTEKLVKDTIEGLRTSVNEALSTIDLPSKEDVANKVSAFQDEPDNQHYPTEKLVYDTLFALHQTITGETTAAINAIDVTSTVVVESLDAVLEPDPNIDYIVRNGNSYLFYKYIEEEWKMIGGAMAYVGEELPEAGDSFTDYYIATETENVYLHYRWIDNAEEEHGGHFFTVGADSYDKEDLYTKAQIDARLQPLETASSQHGSRITQLENDVNALSGNMVIDVTGDANSLTVHYKDGGTSPINIADGFDKVTDVNKTDEGIEIVYSNGDTKPIAISGGGSGGASSGTVTITRITDATVTFVSGDACPIVYRFDATDSAGDVVGSGNATWYVGGVRRATSTANQGRNTFDIKDYLTAGSNTVRLVISVDTGGDTPSVVSKSWTVNVVNMYLTWDYDDTMINDGDTFSIRWTPYGNEISKATHIFIDGREAATSTTTRSGSLQTVTLNSLSHGAHKVELYCTATVNGVDITSDSIMHDMIFAAAGNNTPIIACSVSESEMVQYNTLQIPVVIYTPGALTSNAVLRIDDEIAANWTNIDRTLHYWNFTPSEFGEKTLTITSGSTVKTLRITVTKLDIDNEEVGGYTFRLKASDLAGNDALREWESNGISATFSSNFDWTNGGIKTETADDGSIRQFICIKAGTRMTINHKLFADEARANGKTFKICFKTVNCRDYDATLLDCIADNVGILLTAHEATFRSTGLPITVPYGDDEYIELEYDIYPQPKTENDGNFRYMMAWIDGVITTCRVYAPSDNFTQSTANQKNLVIGSDDCDVYLYLVKAYPSYLTRESHMDNFIADAPNAREMVARYNRNNILDESGEIDYQKLIDANPDCRVWLYDIPYMTIGKKDKVKNCTFNQFWKNGDSYYELSGTGTMTVQGTSSVDYLKGAANTDINFTSLTDGNGNDLMANGVVDEDHYGKNFFVGNPETGEVTVFDVDENTVLTPDCIAVERDEQRNVTKYIKALGYKINDDSCPITYSNTKVNFASCEQVNNMCNAIWYQRFQPYQSLTHRDCMEFSMGVQFIKDSGETPDSDHFVLFGDDKYHMYSIGNMGNSKKNVHVFHDLSNPNDCCIEVGNNLDDLCRMVTVEGFDNLVMCGGSSKSFEMRYPDMDVPSQEIVDGWRRFVTWMAESNPNAATNELLPAPETYGAYTFRGHDRGGTQVLRGTTVSRYAGRYERDTFERRMAKMLSECENYMVMDSVIYHFVYLERHTMCDNVAKNSFWSSTDLLHWDLSKAYDMDTSDGNNNEGKMVFDYGNEADDTIGTKTVFNAADAVWFVFASNLFEACEVMFQNRETAGAWSATEYHKFLLEQQRKIPERVWVQCYWYDYLRTYEQGIVDEEAWLPFLDGGQKTHQRWHYEYFEEIYDSSKYVGTSATSNNVNFRGYYPTQPWDEASAANWENLKPKAEIKLKMYNKCYINVKVDSTSYRMKAERGVPYTVDFSAQEKLNDTVINIYSAQMIQEIGDMSRLYPGTVNMSNATRLRQLTVGSTTPGYANSNLESISIGNNPMLEHLYLQNLAYITNGLNLSKCVSLLTLDASGSSFTSYDFATGGLLRTAYIEAPTSLTMIGLHALENSGLVISDYSKLLSWRLENCENLNTRSLIENAYNLNRLRLLGVDWTVTDTTLLNRLLTLSGLDENGSNTTTSVLAGDVVVNGPVRQQELNQYAEHWPNLNVTYSGELVPQYYVYFVNDDGTELYRMLVDRGSVASDPIAAGLIDTPTKASDEQYDYTFDSWENLPGTVIAEKTVTAIYTSSIRSYTVEWYLHKSDIEPRCTKTVQYGTEANYDKERPTDTSSEATLNYRLFAGWDKSTGSVKENMKVYAVWAVQDGLPSTDKTLNDMTPAELYAVSADKKASTYFDVKDTKDIQLGSDFNFSNVESELLLENEYFGGSKYVTKNIKLFGEDSPAYTIALDFEMQSTNNARATLFSCCDTSRESDGMFLHYTNGGPKLTWQGSTTRPAGNASERTIIVLRHKKGSQNIVLYTFNLGNGVYDDAITEDELIGPKVPVTDEIITFGAKKYGNSYENYAKGWVYWCKIWHDDLGKEVCMKLASWPHITHRVEFCGTNINARADGGRTSMTFISNEALPLYRAFNGDNSLKGWDESALRTFYNTRIFNGLSYEWQSALKMVSMKSIASSTSSAIVTTVDNLYAPALADLGINSNVDPYSGELSNPDLGQISYYTTDLDRLKFFLPKEDREDITPGRQVIVSTDDPTRLTTRYTVAQGDIWRRTNNGAAYMYLSADYVSKHTTIGRYDLTAAGTSFGNDAVISAYDGGVWILPCQYWTRTPFYDESTSTSYIHYIGANGTFGYNTPRNPPMGLVFGFSI